MLKAQIWIETVIYTLIGLTIIGIMLGFVKPAIDEGKDRVGIEQAEQLLSAISITIDDLVSHGVGNSRPIDTKFASGKLIINSINDTVTFETESKFKKSEPGIIVNSGNIQILTIPKGDRFLVTLTLDYSNKINITSSFLEIEKTIQSSSTQSQIVLNYYNYSNTLPIIDIN